MLSSSKDTAMSITIYHSTPSLLKTSIDKAISELSLSELTALRNQLRPNEHFFVCNDDQIKSCYIREIWHWGESIEISFTENDDLPTQPISYWINNVPSDTSFATEQEALIHAFEKYVILTI
jgi:hypothetical protein